MHHSQVAGLGLERLDVTVARDTRRHNVVAPPVPGLSRDGMRRRTHDNVRLDRPCAKLLKFDWRRRVFRVPPRGTVIDPQSNRFDLIVTQRTVVLEALHAHFRVNMPRWHLADLNLVFDGTGPRASLLVTHQRHRRHVVGPVAHLAGALKNRFHILMKRRVLRHLGCSRRWQHGHQANR